MKRELYEIKKSYSQFLVFFFENSPMLKKRSKDVPVVMTGGDVAVKDRLQILSKEERYAVLATGADGGQPYTSFIAYALTKDLKGVVFSTPKKTSKHRNILKNPLISVLIDSRFQSGYPWFRSIFSVWSIPVLMVMSRGYSGLPTRCKGSRGTGRPYSHSGQIGTHSKYCPRVSVIN